MDKVITQTQPDRVLRATLEQHGYRSSSATFLAGELVKSLQQAGWHLLGTAHEIRAPNHGFGRESEDFDMRVQLDDQLISHVQTLPRDLIESWADLDGLITHTRRKLAHAVLDELGRRLGLPL